MIEPLQPISAPLHLPQNPQSCNAAECEGWPRTAAASSAYSTGPSNDNEKGAIAGGAYILSQVLTPRHALIMMRGEILTSAAAFKSTCFQLQLRSLSTPQAS